MGRGPIQSLAVHLHLCEWKNEIVSKQKMKQRRSNVCFHALVLLTDLNDELQVKLV